MEYEFYSKPMANPVIIPADSALPSRIKMSTYRQEVFRVLANTSESLPWNRKAELLTNIAHRMELSGYETGFIVTAINGGVRAHLKVLADHQQNGRPIHRSKEERKEREVRGGVEIIGFSQEEGPTSSILQSSLCRQHQVQH